MIVIAAFLLVPSVARADDRPWAEGVSEPAQKVALALYERGNKLFVEKSYAEALKLYRQAILTWDHPAIRFNIAECLMSLDQPLEAYENLIMSLRFGEPALGAEHFERATRTKILLEGLVSHLEVKCDEPGAVVSLDGKRLFVAPGTATRTLMPGSHQIVASKAGYVTITREEVLAPRKHVTADLRLVRSSKLEHRWTRWKPWAVAGVGVAIALVGVVFRFQAQSAFDEFSEDLAGACPLGCVRNEVPADVRELEDRGKRFELASGTAFALGGAAIVTGLVLVILNDQRSIESPLRRASIHVDGTTASLAFRF